VSQASSQINPLLFEKVPEGYAFHAPNRWIFGRPDRYVTTAAQAKDIGAMLRLTWSDTLLAGLATAIIAVAAFLAGDWLPIDLHGVLAATRLAIIAGLGAMPVLAGFQVWRGLQLRRLRPILARLPRTTE
jgi:hypothetical protein